MVPTDKSKLTDMLHQYIQAHKPEKHKNKGQINGSVSLVTGQSEAVQREYSAVMMLPKERVSALLKSRDNFRKIARDANRISGHKIDVQAFNSPLFPSDTLS